MVATAAYAADGRDMSIGRVMSRAFAAIGSAPVLFLGIGLVLVALPSVTTQLLLGASAPSTGNGIAALVPLLLSTAGVWWVLYMAAQAMLFRATVGWIDGRPVAFGELARVSAAVLLPLCGLALLLSLAVWIGFMLFVVPGVILALMWSVAAPALVIERTGVFGAFGRSRELTRGARWRILGLVALVFAIYMIVSLVLGLGSVALSGFGTRVRAAPTVVGGLLSLVVQTGFVAIWSAIQAALFVDLRDGRDGPAGDRLAEIFA